MRSLISKYAHKSNVKKGADQLIFLGRVQVQIKPIRDQAYSVVKLYNLEGKTNQQVIVVIGSIIFVDDRRLAALYFPGLKLSYAHRL